MISKHRRIKGKQPNTELWLSNIYWILLEVLMDKKERIRYVFGRRLAILYPGSRMSERVDNKN